MARTKKAVKLAELPIPAPVNEQFRDHPFVRYLTSNGFTCSDIIPTNWAVLKPLYNTYMRFVYDQQLKDQVAEYGEVVESDYYSFKEFADEVDDFMIEKFVRSMERCSVTTTVRRYMQCPYFYELHKIIKEESNKYKYTGDAIADGIRDAGKEIGEDNLCGMTRIANKIHYHAHSMHNAIRPYR